MEYPAQRENFRQQSINTLLLPIIVYLTLDPFSTLSATHDLRSFLASLNASHPAMRNELQSKVIEDNPIGNGLDVLLEELRVPP
jgi:hypothetical protein